MFMMAVTHRDVRAVVDGPTVGHVVSHGRHVTVFADGGLAKIGMSDDALAVQEGPDAPGSAGEAVLSRVVFDRRQGSLTAARFTSGGRPIYYARTGDDEFFCSTHVSMLRRMGVPVRENVATVAEFFVYCFVTPPATLFSGINQLPYGGTLTLDLSAQASRLTVSNPLASSVSVNAPGPVALDRAEEQTLELLRAGLLRLAGAGPCVSMLLSGGLDSSILAVLGRDVLAVSETYSTGYPFEEEARNTERQYALSAATALGTTHRYHEPSGEAYLYGLLETIAAVEEPLHGLQTVLLGLLFRDGLPGGKSVVVCGQGADGLFGLDMHEAIFRSHQGSRVAWRVASPQAIAVARLWARFSKIGEYAVSRLDLCWRQSLPLEDPRHLIWDLQRYGDSRWVRSHFGVSDDAIIANRLNALEPFRGRDLLDLVSILDLAGDVAALQSLWSKVGESQGKMLVYPYTHEAVLRLALALPWPEKLAEKKGVLRGVARRLGVPEPIVTRPKSGFGLAASRWGRRGGIFEPLVPLACRVWPLEVIRGAQAGTEGLSHVYWNLLNHAIWKRLHIGGEPLDVLRDELSASLERQRRGQTAA